MKREIALLESEKSLEDLYHMADVHLIGIHCFKGLPKWLRVIHEMIIKVLRLKKELKAISPCCVIVVGKIIGKPSKLCRN